MSLHLIWRQARRLKVINLKMESSLSKEPEYILGEGPLKVAVFNQYGNFDFDSIYIMDPSESESKGWEIWYAEWHDTDLRSADLKYKIIEIHSDWITTPEHVHLVN